MITRKLEGGILAKVMIILLIWVGCLLPIEVFYVLYHLVRPESDLVRLLLFGIGLYFFGFIQFILLIFGIYITIIVMKDF